MNQQTSGRVYLVGAGPGDPGLITLRGIECLRRADVVLYDYLINPRLLRHARSDAELICLGQHRKSRLWTQDEINTQLVERANAGKTVVRLKGGDPAVFARGAEEALTLTQHGIPFEVVPGVTTALAASSYAGIPVTHRDLASAVALITGQEDEEKGESVLDYAALARFPGTLVFYMGVTTVEHWSTALIAAGKLATTPVAIVRRCSWPDQRIIRCQLGELATRLNASPRIRPPAIIIIGDVVPLGESLSWFDKRPLFGQRILVTRSQEQAPALTELLEDLGAEVWEQPAIEIGPPADWRPVDDAISKLDTFAWLVFSSANGVRFFLNRLLATRRDLRALGQIRIAAIGPGSSAALATYHLRPDLQPDEYRAEALAAALVPQAAGQRFLVVRASRGREVLADQLTAAGGDITQVVAYASTDVATPRSEVVELINAGKIDWITVTSSAIARSLQRLFGDALKKSSLVSISPVTSATLQELGLVPTREAVTYTMPGIVEAIQRPV